MTNLSNFDWSKLPAPVDDGAADHLRGLMLPSVPLPTTDGGAIDLAVLGGVAVVYVYPMTGQPGVALPEGWDIIPGARGCTPQACAFRDHFAELHALGVDHVLGLSAQCTQDQREAASRLHLPFPLVSDTQFALADALRLPTFTTAGLRLLRRLTMVIVEGCIEHVFYPVFPPDRNAHDVIAWLAARAVQARRT
jgi:peroxiredoxin